MIKMRKLFLKFKATRKKRTQLKLSKFNNKKKKFNISLLKSVKSILKDIGPLKLLKTIKLIIILKKKNYQKKKYIMTHHIIYWLNILN